MLRARNKADSRSGNTLLEVVISLVVFLTMLGAAVGVIASSQGAYTEMSASLTAEEQANRVLDRIVWELRFAPLETIDLAPTVDARTVTFSKVQGWNAGTRVLSGPQTLSFDSERVLWNGVVIAEGITDLTFNMSGNVLTAVLELERTATVAGIPRTFEVDREVKVAF
jgi:hypothetical protein